MVSRDQIIKVYNRLKPFVNKTPLVISERLNKMLGHEIIFKAEGIQLTGAFKVRGVLNTLLTLDEQNLLPKKAIAYSSGNHAKALAWAGSNIVNIPTEIYMHKSASLSKRQAILELGSNLIITETRLEAEEKAKSIGSENDHYFIHPSDNDLVLQGASTLTYEALKSLSFEPDAIFAACGGGALLSGVYLGRNAMGFNSKIFAAEPEIANDASRSYKFGKIVGFNESPQTMADGLRTLKVSARTFNYLQKLDGFIEVSEEEILYWSVWLHELLEVPCEPTAATSMAAAFKWLKLQNKKQKVLVILSGGNLDKEVIEILKFNERLNHDPKIL